MTRIGRNDPCPCGSGKKYKRCCGSLPQNAASEIDSKGLEIISLEDGLTTPYTSVEMVDLIKLSEKIAKAPQDYIFILSESDWDKWANYHLQTMELLSGAKNADEMNKLLGNAMEAQEVGPTILISYLSALPEVGGKYKIGSLTSRTLGDCFAVFFVKAGQEQQRANQIEQYVKETRQSSAAKPPLS